MPLAADRRDEDGEWWMEDGLVGRASSASHCAGFISSHDLLEGKSGSLRPGLGVLNGEAANVALPVQIQNRVLVQILRFGDVGRLELKVKAVRLGKIFDFHDLNRRSKNAW
jgi:hypothetical protein